MKISKQSVSQFQNTIYQHYKTNGRHFLPWRKTHDPYKILVSEIMLQQTQVERVIEKYKTFIRKYPTVKSLAVAPLMEILTVWQGLGYNRRALYLKTIAENIVSLHNGKIPPSVNELQRLPGIGRATAAAVVVFGHNKPIPFIETNIRTVYLHFFFRSKRKVDDKQILPIVEATMESTNPRKWFYSLMDYGAMLKKENIQYNPQSKHYVKQSRFEGSNRQLRGIIIKSLLDGIKTEHQLIKITGRSKIKVRENLRELVSEGFLRREGRYYSIK